MKTKLEKYLFEYPHEYIRDGEGEIETVDFFSELHGEKVLKSKHSNEYIIFNWIDNLVDFYKTRKWRHIVSYAKPPYFVPNGHVRQYDLDEMQQWTDKIINDAPFIASLRVALNEFSRKDWFMNLDVIPDEIKTALYPSWKKI